MKFSRFAPMLLCSDVSAAKAYYVECLGLQVNADSLTQHRLQKPAGQLPVFEMSLCSKDHSSLPPSCRSPSQGLVLAFEVADLESSLRTVKEQKVTILEEPRDEPWGQRHFFAAAPDGVVLDIFTSIPPDPEWMKAHGFA